MGAGPSKFKSSSYYKSKKKKLQIIDFGSILPLGLYNKSDEYDLNLVKDLILAKKLSPFYKGLSSPLQLVDQVQHNKDNLKQRYELGQGDTTVSIRKKKRLTNKKQKSTQHGLKQEEEFDNDYSIYFYNNEKKLYNLLYTNSVECPICFLYYPANINFARCCDQPICTECFVQIKKGPVNYTLSSSSSSSCDASNIVCPYCMAQDFGIIYQSPPLSSSSVLAEQCYQVLSTTSGLSENQHSKRKSIESSHPDVVLIDHVRLQHNRTTGNNKRLIRRAASLQFWFQSRPTTTSLERYLATIRLDDMSLEDVMVIESIRQSLMDTEQNHHRRSMY